jgi:sarcosine oxidase subunit gamma
MAESRIATLSRPLDGRQTILAGVAIVPRPLALKLSLRVPESAIADAGAAFGLDLPTQPCRSVTSGTRSALWLGPDEWMIVDENAEAPVPALAAPGSVVDISHRNCTIEISGALAEPTLAAGCPLDLALPSFPVGKCTRTVLAKAEIILWRTGEQAFRVDCWTSFAEYVFTYLSRAAQAARY